MLLRLARHAMGTRFELVLAGEREAHLRAAGEEALFEIEEAERQLSLFRKDSLLSHLNRSGATRAVRVDADTWELFTVCDEVARASGGAFDPTVAALMKAHGLHDDSSGAPAVDAETARSLTGWDAVELDPVHRAIRFRRPGTTIDLGAIGKGHGLDLAAAALRDAGVACALLHGGTSTVVALGAPPDAPPDAHGWRVALGPGDDAPVALLSDVALSVSAPEGRSVEGPGGTRTHVLDPRTGEPARAGVLRAAAIASSAARADAVSTALLVAGDALPELEGVETCWASGSPTSPSWNHRAATGAPRLRILHPHSTA